LLYLRGAMPIAAIVLDANLDDPLYRQLYNGLRDAILTGRLAAGARLPATRALAAELAISRNTVLDAYAQLLAEGYVEGQVGSGTYVARSLPEELLHADGASEGPAMVNRPPPAVNRSISRRGALLAATSVMAPTTDHRPPTTDHRPPTIDHRPPARGGEGERGRGGEPAITHHASRFTHHVSHFTHHVSRITFHDRISFRPGQPALDRFPAETWGRIVARRWRRPPAELLGYGEAAGYAPLREQIAAYLGAARAVRCDMGQVIVVGGSQQALDLAARVLLDPDDAVWIEEPGYLGARGALLGAGARLIPVPVDRDGLDVAAGMERGAHARLAYVTPSYQYPMGVTMSLARRLALLEWASRTGAWVLEDDYDSEYRYAGRPLAALQGLDLGLPLDGPLPSSGFLANRRDGGRVIYIGTFSKVLFPALRLGYLIVPPDLVDAFVAARALTDRHPPTVEQAVLADFIAEGHFARHIRRTRALYAARQAALVEAANRDLCGWLEVRPAEAGMHLVGWLPQGQDDRAASLRAAEDGVEAPPLSAYAALPPRRGGLLLGYTGLDEPQIREGVRRLAAALEDRG
jgi:GntR family transcriptional regulator/MocR family aminotransferase